MKRTLFTLIALLVLSAAAWADDKEMYAVLSPDGTTFTFYYDSQKASREGTKYALNTGYSGPDWANTTTAQKIKTVDFDQSFADARPSTTYSWFYGMSNCTAIQNIKNLNTSNVTNMSSMFRGCSSLTSLDLSHFDTSKVENMEGMFEDCSSLTFLDLSSFNIENTIQDGRMSNSHSFDEENK